MPEVIGTLIFIAALFFAILLYGYITRRKSPEMRKKILFSELPIWIFGVLWLVTMYFIIIHSVYFPNIQQLLTATLSVISVLWAVLSARRATSADVRSSQTLEKLEENQIIATETLENFKTIFDQHLIDRLKITQTYNKAKVSLLLSTPIFGYHPLGGSEFERFIKTLFSHPEKNEIEIILSTPDHHYFHWLNTLIWQPINGNKNERATIAQYGTLLLETLHIFRQNKDILTVWAGNDGILRLFAFHGQTIKPKEYNLFDNVFLVLTDKVTLASDLQHFQGRSFPVVKDQHRLIVGTETSYFDQFKLCSYSLDKNHPVVIGSTNAKDELGVLFSDYFLGRTSGMLMKLSSFEYQFNNLLEQQSKSKTEQKDLKKRILLGVINYWQKVIPNFKQQLFQSLNDEENKRISFLIKTNLLNLLYDENWENQIKNCSPFLGQSRMHDQRNPFILILYYLISAGFNNSEFATRSSQKNLKKQEVKNNELLITKK